MPQLTVVPSDSIKIKGGGRPKKYGETLTQVTISIPKSIIEFIKVKAKNNNFTVNEQIRKIIVDQMDLEMWAQENG